MLDIRLLTIYPLLADSGSDQNKLIIYAILIFVFLGLTIFFGYLYFKLRDDDSPVVKMPHKPIKRY